MKEITIGLLTLAAIGGACRSYSTEPADTREGDSVEPPPATFSVEGGGRTGFGFLGTVSGAPTGIVFLSGGGSFAAATASDVVPGETDVASGGGFRCVAGVAQGPLAGCEAGQGVRWEAAQLLATTGFRCTRTDAAKIATTGPGLAVLLADFYRAGDGTDESFVARMIVSTTDIAPDLPGDQTLWVQGVGCGDANPGFSR